jgi:hypothetical protein
LLSAEVSVPKLSRNSSSVDLINPLFAEVERGATMLYALSLLNTFSVMVARRWGAI